MKALAALAALLLLPESGQQERPLQRGEQYVPPDTWAGEWDAEFYEVWFGRQLRATGEPILWRPDDLSWFRRRFRTVVLPSFSRPYSVRVDVTSGGRALVTAVNSGRVREDGKVEFAAREQYHLDREDVSALFDAVRRSGVEELPPRPERTDDSPICLDGIYYAFEFATRRSHRLVLRHSCELDDGLRRLIRTVELLRSE